MYLTRYYFKYHLFQLPYATPALAVGVVVFGGGGAAVEDVAARCPICMCAPVKDRAKGADRYIVGICVAIAPLVANGDRVSAAETGRIVRSWRR